MDTKAVNGYPGCGWIPRLWMDTQAVDGYPGCGWISRLWMMDTQAVDG